MWVPLEVGGHEPVEGLVGGEDGDGGPSRAAGSTGESKGHGQRRAEGQMEPNSEE